MVGDSMLEEGLCVLTFEYEDESQVKVVTTRNKDILKDLGVEVSDCLVDLTTMKIIPMDVLERIKYVEKGAKYKYDSKLDEIMEVGVKLNWKVYEGV